MALQASCQSGEQPSAQRGAVGGAGQADWPLGSFSFSGRTLPRPQGGLCNQGGGERLIPVVLWADHIEHS